MSLSPLFNALFGEKLPDTEWCSFFFGTTLFVLSSQKMSIVSPIPSYRLWIPPTGTQLIDRNTAIFSLPFFLFFICFLCFSCLSFPFGIFASWWTTPTHLTRGGGAAAFPRYMEFAPLAVLLGQVTIETATLRRLPISALQCGWYDVTHSPLKNEWVSAGRTTPPRRHPYDVMPANRTLRIASRSEPQQAGRPLGTGQAMALWSGRALPSLRDQPDVSVAAPERDEKRRDAKLSPALSSVRNEQVFREKCRLTKIQSSLSRFYQKGENSKFWATMPWQNVVGKKREP